MVYLMTHTAINVKNMEETLRFIRRRWDFRKSLNLRIRKPAIRGLYTFRYARDSFWSCFIPNQGQRRLWSRRWA